MKNKKGFTMVELLGIITILGVLLIMTVPSLTATLKRSTQKEYDSFIDNLLIATETYIESNRSLYPSLDKPSGRAIISIQTLIDNNLIEKTVIDPKTEEEVPTYNTITAIKQDDGTIFYAYNSEDASTNGYVASDLILLYDGYNRPDNNVWKDISGNDNDGVLKEFNNDETSGWQGDSIAFDGIDDHIDLGNKLQALFNNSNTIEMVVYFEPTKIRTILIGNYPENNSINIEKGYTTLQGRIFYNNGSINYFTPNDFHTLGVKNSYTYVLDKINKKFSFYSNSSNKYEVTNNDFANNYDFKNAKIGTDNRTERSEVTLKGKIYSIRVYDRVLSDAEIAQNYKIDQVRFGLGE